MPAIDVTVVTAIEATEEAVEEEVGAEAVEDTGIVATAMTTGIAGTAIEVTAGAEAAAEVVVEEEEEVVTAEAGTGTSQRSSLSWNRYSEHRNEVGPSELSAAYHRPGRCEFDYPQKSQNLSLVNCIIRVSVDAMPSRDALPAKCL